jgi:lactate dehydrogenase-like 2-hydroxyacid dehydrogenase
MGSMTAETRSAVYTTAVNNLLAVLDGQPPLAIVNPEVLAGS